MRTGVYEMITSDSKGIKQTLLPMVLCLCFIASSLVFLAQMIRKSQEENITYLYNAANQTKTSILKQIEGDKQTLEALAVIMQDLDVVDEERILRILKDINDRNAFIRMGYADVRGDAALVDLDGSVYETNLRGMDFFRQALEGEMSISNTFQDTQKEGAYINYYGAPIKNREGRVKGVLCAVHSSVILREIIDAPLLKGAGYSNILDKEGRYILKTIKTYPGDILEENRVRITESIASGGTGDFILTDRTGTKQMLVIMPLIEGQWYLASMVPLDILKANYIETAIGIMAIIVVACGLFIWLMTLQRISAARNRKMLMDLAYKDSVTGLRNFDGFKLDAGKIMKRSDRSSYILWYGDIKNFKFINDVLGYKEGDRLLKSLGTYFKMAETDDCITCRSAADNFVGIVKCQRDDFLERGIQSALEHLERTGTEGRTFIEIPVGAYRLRPGDEGQSIDVLVNYANMAHTIAKEKAGSGYVFYDDGIRRRIIEDTALEAAAQTALRNGEFQAYMQPKINIQKGNLLNGAEVLARWVTPDKGMIPPDRFIPIFEKSDLIVQLDRYMLEKACRWLADYLNKGRRPINLAVNVSQVGLLKPDFIEYYSGIKEKYRIPHGVLELEFTESMLAGDTDMFADVVMKLKKRGFICSMDDFGSGYSSLNLLKNLPIDVLKLDILFFQKSRDINRERIVTRNFIQMARELHIKTIAEGVEQADGVEFLRDAGCDVVQGYVFSRPLPEEEFNRLVEEAGDKPFACREEA